MVETQKKVASLQRVYKCRTTDSSLRPDYLVVHYMLHLSS